jgi:hypothetical protein
MRSQHLEVGESIDAAIARAMAAPHCSRRWPPKVKSSWVWRNPTLDGCFASTAFSWLSSMTSGQEIREKDVTGI